ncbi:hypothetical protein K437DRAFT_263247 [Tilletiaria anomala UBC 951]|uniref:Uncharacterized protein n=1 Tax=Tilletiaria anomala (strain ATCC 24038 / CBS 436.72 / UBC 951) TaxID=1037660 RepID=A0A066W001_TILAU|nr:uncharacterized protein K437DRAFT_263247 [Tilletiaria anomala UBC 951]KDN44369.1 hypothetical protein K437DRAFT_263247 [Tilletiaria anomala UBC 951]
MSPTATAPKLPPAQLIAPIEDLTLISGLLEPDDSSSDEEKPRSRRSKSPSARSKSPSGTVDPAAGLKHKSSKDRLANAIIDGGAAAPPRSTTLRSGASFTADDNAPPVPKSSVLAAATKLPAATASPSAYPGATMKSSPVAVQSPLPASSSPEPTSSPRSGGPPSPIIGRPRSGSRRSSGFLSRITSGGRTSSSASNDLALFPSRDSTHSQSSSSKRNNRASESPKADMVDLAKPKSKFKSGVNWNAVGVYGANPDDDAFMQSSPTREGGPELEDEIGALDDAPAASSTLASASAATDSGPAEGTGAARSHRQSNIKELQEIAGMGSTAAVRALANNSDLSAVLFPAARKAVQQQEANAQAFAAMGFQSVPTSSRLQASPSSPRDAPGSAPLRPATATASLPLDASTSPSSSTAQQMCQASLRGTSAGAGSASPVSGSVFVNGRPQQARGLSERVVNEAAQRVLQEARSAAMGRATTLNPQSTALNVGPPSQRSMPQQNQQLVPNLNGNGSASSNGTGPAKVASSGSAPPSAYKAPAAAVATERGNRSEDAKSAGQSSEVHGSSKDSVKDSRRRSLLSMPSFHKEKKEKEDKRQTRSRGPSRASTPPPEGPRTGGGGGTPGNGNSKAAMEEGTSVPGRRRRWADTRELDLLATELAAQALADQHLSQGVSHFPFSAPISAQLMQMPTQQLMSSSSRANSAHGHSNPGSASVGGNGGGGGGGMFMTPSNQSQISFHGGSSGSATSSASGHVLGGGLGPLSQIKPNSLPASAVPDSAMTRSSPPGSGFAMNANETRSLDSMSIHSVGSIPRTTRSMPGTPYTSTRSQLGSLPPDMLTGLGDGPYPSLGRRLPLDPMDAIGLDPFGFPVSRDQSLFETSSLPGQPITTHSTSSRHASIGSNDSKHLKKAVISMSMNDPNSAAQGLVKQSRSGWSSPFGGGSRSNSRPPSRSVTPTHSNSNLREKAKAQEMAVHEKAQASEKRQDKDASRPSAAAASAEDAGPRTETRPTAPRQLSAASNESAKESGAKQQEFAADMSILSQSSGAGRSTLSVNTIAMSKQQSRMSFFGSLRRKSQVDLHDGSLKPSVATAPSLPPLPASPVARNGSAAAPVGSSASIQVQADACHIVRRRSKSESSPRSGRLSRFMSRFGGNSRTSSQQNSAESSGATTPSMPPVNKAALTKAQQRVDQGAAARGAPSTPGSRTNSPATTFHSVASAETSLQEQARGLRPEGTATHAATQPAAAFANASAPASNNADAGRKLDLSNSSAQPRQQLHQQPQHRAPSSSPSVGSQGADGDLSPPTSESMGEAASVRTPSTEMSGSYGVAAAFVSELGNGKLAGVSGNANASVGSVVTRVFSTGSGASGALKGAPATPSAPAAQANMI